MVTSEASVADQIRNLEQARKLVLGDSAYYPQIVQGILPIIGANAVLELRRWGADFMAEMFASPTLATQQKETLSVRVLETLRAMLDVPDQDPDVLKGVIQASASIYPLVYRHIVTHPTDTAAWERMAAIKSRILKIWDTAPLGVRVCCIKFVQRVIQSQTPGLIADPRRPEQNEISLAIVPRNHPLIPPPHLEAEASGLLDRMLNVFQENELDAILVNSTLNCLGILIRSRQSVSNKIVSAILNFNPLKQATPSLSSKTKVVIKSMERTTRSLLANINKLNPEGPLASRIQQHIERLVRSRTELFDDINRKRPAPTEPTDGLDPAKRARLGAHISGTPESRFVVPPLPPGPTSIAQLFTLTDDEALSSFDVQQLPIDLVIQITLPVMYRLERGLLDGTINAIRSRHLQLSQQTPHAALQSGLGPEGVDDEDDDYEPDFQPAEDDEQILNKLDAVPPEPESIAPLAPFKMPQPLPLNADEVGEAGQATVGRVFEIMNGLEQGSRSKKTKTGINRLAGSDYDKDAWTTIITRLATRAASGLEITSEEIKVEGQESAPARPNNMLTDSIRSSLYMHVLEDFRRRIDTAIAWLNEEWYSDRVQTTPGTVAASTYETWAVKLLDGILPYLDARDNKIFTRFLSEIPSINEKVLERVKSLARDPERVALAVSSLHYLILLRPPARELALDALEDLWRNYEDARTSAAKVLVRWRPQVVQAEAKPPAVEGTPMGTSLSPPAAPNGVLAAS
ncbi:MAG: hypothetical protein M4579_003974 [Chaenotheca gracillima]|nr:MAG: hypothetical protein M4579_003974 [Chaenotheca gracillima]